MTAALHTGPAGSILWGLGPLTAGEDPLRQPSRIRLSVYSPGWQPCKCLSPFHTFPCSAVSFPEARAATTWWLAARERSAEWGKAVAVLGLGPGGHGRGQRELGLLQKGPFILHCSLHKGCPWPAAVHFVPLLHAMFPCEPRCCPWVWQHLGVHSTCAFCMSEGHLFCSGL